MKLQDRICLGLGAGGDRKSTGTGLPGAGSRRGTCETTGRTARLLPLGPSGCRRRLRVLLQSHEGQSRGVEVYLCFGDTCSDLHFFSIQLCTCPASVKSRSFYNQDTLEGRAWPSWGGRGQVKHPSGSELWLVPGGRLCLPPPDAHLVTRKMQVSDPDYGSGAPPPAGTSKSRCPKDTLTLTSPNFSRCLISSIL